MNQEAGRFLQSIGSFLLIVFVILTALKIVGWLIGA